ncbi:hypothetical protein ACVUSL_22160, partial [Escherichia coli]
DVFAGKKSAQIREILINESAWEEMTCLFAPSLKPASIRNQVTQDIRLALKRYEQNESTESTGDTSNE